MVIADICERRKRGAQNAEYLEASWVAGQLQSIQLS